jgi:hypothetical protein
LSKVQFEESEDLIDICYDNVFKAVFTRDTPESLGALSKLISALIGQEVTVLSLVANEPPIDNIRDRQIRYDINCQTRDTKQVNVEMALKPDPSSPSALSSMWESSLAGRTFGVKTSTATRRPMIC